MKPEILTIARRQDLRLWLSQNHHRETGLWLATYKKHHLDHLPWLEVVEELICWGWVDAQVAKLDADRSMHRVAPRKAKSAWSAVNKDIVARMREAGQMTDAGEAAIARAQANGMWMFLDDVERLELPDDLAAALGSLSDAWESYPRSVKRGTLEWIKTAKRPETRANRIADVVAALTAGERPSPFR